MYIGTEQRLDTREFYSVPNASSFIRLMRSSSNIGRHSGPKCLLVFVSHRPNSRVHRWRGGYIAAWFQRPKFLWPPKGQRNLTMATYDEDEEGNAAGRPSIENEATQQPSPGLAPLTNSLTPTTPTGAVETAVTWTRRSPRFQQQGRDAPFAGPRHPALQTVDEDLPAQTDSAQGVTAPLAGPRVDEDVPAPTEVRACACVCECFFVRVCACACAFECAYVCVNS